MLHALENLSQHVGYKTSQDEHIVGHALSLTNVVKETRKALVNQSDAYRIPSIDSQRGPKLNKGKSINQPFQDKAPISSGPYLQLILKLLI